jgi:hypothetical protein
MKTNILENEGVKQIDTTEEDPTNVFEVDFEVLAKALFDRSQRESQGNLR